MGEEKVRRRDRAVPSKAPPLLPPLCRQQWRTPFWRARRWWWAPWWWWERWWRRRVKQKVRVWSLWCAPLPLPLPACRRPAAAPAPARARRPDQSLTAQGWGAARRAPGRPRGGGGRACRAAAANRHATRSHACASAGVECRASVEVDEGRWGGGFGGAEGGGGLREVEKDFDGAKIVFRVSSSPADKNKATPSSFPCRTHSTSRPSRFKQQQIKQQQKTKTP